MKLLIVGLNYAPEPVGIGPYTAGMAQALAAQGMEVRVIAGQPYYPQWQRYPGYTGLWRTSSEAQVTVTRCAHYIPHEPTGVRRILHLASFGLSALVPALRAVRWQPDVVLCVVPALLSAPAAWLAARLSGAKFWLHLQDFEVDAAFATGLVAGRGWAARLALALERRLLLSADRASTIGPQMAARLALKGVAPDRIVEVRNWANLVAGAQATDSSAYRAEWDLGSRTVALYSGNIANKQGIEILIEAARRLGDRDDIAIVICGEGPNRARLAALAKGLTNVQLHDLQPAERMGDLLAMADVHLLPQIPGAEDLVLPSKLTNMLASGRPVLATALLGSGLYAEVEGCGLLVTPGDADGLAKAIVSLADDPARARLLGAAAAERARARWSQAAIIDRLAAELRRVAASGREAIPGDAAMQAAYGATAGESRTARKGQE